MRASDAGRFVRRAVVASLVSGAVVAAPLAAQPAVAASSWDTNRTEEFSKGALPKGCNTYGGPYEGGKSYWKKDGVKLSGGLLRLRLEEKAGGKGYPYTSGGVGCWDWAQQYGRYEVRAKVPQGKGIDSYITLMPSKPGDAAWSGIEILAPGPDETAYITNGFGTDTETARMPGTYSDGFHTYVIEWAPNLVRMSVDDEIVFSSSKSFKGKRWLGMVVSNGDALTGVPDASTKLPAEFEIDYVKTATYTGVPPAPKATVSPATAPSKQASAPPLKVPATTPAAAPAAAATSAETDEGSALAGGVWPWLLGGSMIAGLAVVSLSYPRGRRDDDDDDAPEQPRRRGMRGGAEFEPGIDPEPGLDPERVAADDAARREIDLRPFDAPAPADDEHRRGPRTGPINVG